MVCPSSVLAHLTKLIVTIGCWKCLGDPYRPKGRSWSLRAFQILLAHSVLGIFRFGAPFTTSPTTVSKYFRSFYDWYSGIVNVVPLALYTTGVLSSYGVNEEVRLVVLSLGIMPVFFQLSTQRKESQIRRLRLLVNTTALLQLFMLSLVCLRNSNYNVISLVVAYIFERFFIDEFCYRYDIPNIDLTQYSLSFIEIFMVLTMNEL